MKVFPPSVNWFISLATDSVFRLFILSDIPSKLFKNTKRYFY